MKRNLRNQIIINIILIIVLISGVIVYFLRINSKNSKCNEYVEIEAICANSIKDSDVFNSLFKKYLEKELNYNEVLTLKKLIDINNSSNEDEKHYISLVDWKSRSGKNKAIASYDDSGYINCIKIENKYTGGDI